LAVGGGGGYVLGRSQILKVWSTLPEWVVVVF